MQLHIGDTLEFTIRTLAVVWQNLQSNLTWNTIHEFYTKDSCSYTCIVRRVSENTGAIFMSFAPQITRIASNIHFLYTNKIATRQKKIALCVWFGLITLYVFSVWFVEFPNRKLIFLWNDPPLSLTSLKSKICSNVVRKRRWNANKAEAALRAVKARDLQFGFRVEARCALTANRICSRQSRVQFLGHSCKYPDGLPPASWDS